MESDSFVVSRDEFICVITLLHRTVRVWNSDTGALLRTMTGHSDEIQVILIVLTCSINILQLAVVKSQEGYCTFFGLKRNAVQLI